jgi:peptidoglycan hydrolase CwlO-like protein
MKKVLIFLIFLLPLATSGLNCEKIEDYCKKVTKSECVKALEDCVKFYEDKIKILEGEIGKTAGQRKNLANEIAFLRKQIEKLNYEIQQTSVMLTETSLQIEETEKSIQKTTERLEVEKERLAEILRAIDEAEKKSFVEILLSEKTLSDFFNNLVYLENLNTKSNEVLSLIKNLKQVLEDQKEALESEREEAQKLLQIQTLQKQESEKTKKQKDYLLTLTEAQYQQLLREKEETEKKAAEIRKRIFELIGIEKAPTFGEAYEIAKWVEKVTGVRPAFLLAVLTQESNLGKNVGQCYLTNKKTGAGIRITTGQTLQRVMAPGPPYSRRNDVAYFLQITKELGKDWKKTPVSCPMSFGWGGAMGPAQFIPSTWMLYKDRLSSILGRTPNPWSVQDAFLAAGLYLAKYGASKKTPEAEWRAALIYFAGSSNSRYSWYAKRVFAYSRQYEKYIEILEKSLTRVFLKELKL